MQNIMDLDIKPGVVIGIAKTFLNIVLSFAPGDDTIKSWAREGYEVFGAMVFLMEKRKPTKAERESLRSEVNDMFNKMNMLINEMEVSD